MQWLHVHGYMGYGYILHVFVAVHGVSGFSAAVSCQPSQHKSISVISRSLHQMEYCCSALSWMTEALSQSNLIKASRPPPLLRGKVTQHLAMDMCFGSLLPY